jgi:hypothetical protein
MDNIFGKKFLILIAVAVVSASFFAQNAFATTTTLSCLSDDGSNPATLDSIAITTPANKLTYTVGDSLLQSDITDLVVTGTYSCLSDDGSTPAGTQVIPITTANISGFDSSVPTVGQVLTVTVGGVSKTYTVDIVPAPVSPSLTSATITSNGSSIGDLNGATLATNDSGSCNGTNSGTTACHTLNVSGVVTANGNLSAESDGFKLQADSTQQTALTAYFTAKGWPSNYNTQIASEIAGTAPFFNFVSDGAGNYSLADGFTYGVSGGTVKNAPLVIDDNYPAGTYTFTGTIGGVSKTVTLTVTKPAPVLSDLSALTAEIGVANTAEVGITIGNVPGNYTQASVDTLNAAITAASAITNAEAQSVVDTAVTTLTSAVSAFTPVGAVPVTGVTLNETSNTLTVGNTDQLTATIVPANATNQTVTWSSSDTSVATVSNNGLVTTVAAGSTIITVTTDDGSSTSTDAITVNNPVPVTPPAPAVSHGGGGGGYSPVTGQVLGAATSTGQVLGASTFQFTNYLRQGMSGDDVVQLQERLRAEGFFTYPTSTGYFGSITLAAVEAYQTAHNIVPASGFVGPLTIAELNSTAPATPVASTCPNGNTVASNCTLAPNAVVASVCPNGMTLASNCTSK